jgi:hypothetical protein
MPKRVRDDEARWRALLRGRSVQRTWHFTPIICVPCILYHGRVLSIRQLERRGLVVPPRASKDDDIRAGVADVVKLSILPYWRMLGSIMRQGNVEVMLEFTVDPVLWDNTTFGSSNVWETCWERDESYDFAAEKVFVPRSQWCGTSPPEIYVAQELPIDGCLIKVHTVLEQERVELKNALHRLGIGRVDVFTAGFSFPFPSAAREEYLKRQPEVFEKVRQYLRNVSTANLREGVILE